MSQFSGEITTASTAPSHQAVVYFHIETRAELHERIANEMAANAEAYLMLDNLAAFSAYAELADVHAACARAAELFEAALERWPRA